MMKASIIKTIQVTAVLLVSLRGESVERKVKIDVVDVKDTEGIKVKAERKYTSIMGLGGQVSIKEVLT